MTNEQVRRIPTPELKEKLHFYTSNKIWQGDYYILNAEVQRRASASWVHADVFGNTFGEYNWNVETQKFEESKINR